MEQPTSGCGAPEGDMADTSKSKTTPESNEPEEVTTPSEDVTSDEPDTDTAPADKEPYTSEVRDQLLHPAVKPTILRTPLNRTVVTAVLLGGLVGWLCGITVGVALDEARHPHVAAAASASSPTDLRTPVERAQQSTVSIAATPKSGDAELGAGVIVSADGYIATTAHLVNKDTAAIRVTTADGVILDAAFVGSDETTGITVVKVNGSRLRPAQATSAADVAAGDPVITVGANNVVTRGSISVTVEGVRTNTTADAAAAPVWAPALRTTIVSDLSRDGGPVVNAAGSLIGINVGTGYTGTATDAEGSFAITSDVVYRVASDLITDGKATHGLLGATIGDSVNGHTGAAIGEVTPGSGADDAGIRSGDIIISFAGQTVTKAGDLAGYVATTRPGTKVTLELIRDGEPTTAKVVLGSR